MTKEKPGIIRIEREGMELTEISELLKVGGEHVVTDVRGGENLDGFRTQLERARMAVEKGFEGKTGVLAVVCKDYVKDAERKIEHVVGLANTSDEFRLIARKLAGQ